MSLLGTPGVRKSHLAMALITQLVQAHAGGELKERLRHFANP